MTHRYDAISIGSGLGGLVASALCAVDGKKVLVLERHTRIGGAASSFPRHGHNVEVGLHAVDGLDEGDAKTMLLKRLGLDKNIEWSRIPDLYRVTSKALDLDFTLEANAENALAALIERFPNHKEGLNRFFGVVLKIRRKISILARRQGSTLYWILNAPIAVFRFWVLGRYERHTVGSFLDSLFGDDEVVKTALCANVGYYSEDPYKLSLLYFSVAQGSYLLGGSHFPKGGATSLCNHLLETIKKSNGEALTGRTAVEIVTENGKAVGVTHVDSKTGKDKKQAFAPAIFGNAAPSVLADMLPAKLSENFYSKYKDYSLSTSLWCVYLAFDKPLSEFGTQGYSTFHFPAWQHTLKQTVENATMMSAPPQERLPFYVLVDYSSIDSGTGRDSFHMASICGLDTLDNWKNLDEDAYHQRKNEWLEKLVDDLNEKYPGAKDHIVYKEFATARSMKRFLNTPGGSLYGFAQEPSQAGRFRPTVKTSVPGLVLASAFSMPGGGFTGAMLAGQNAHRAMSKFLNW